MPKPNQAPKQQAPKKQAPVLVPNDAIWISAKQLRARYGNRSAMWLHRKLSDPDFPKPSLIGRLNFYKIEEIENYERSLVAARDKRSAAAHAEPPRGRGLGPRDRAS